MAMAASPKQKSLFSLIWSGPDVLGLFSINLVPSGSLFSINVVRQRAMLNEAATRSP
jgi:hypothetical protein